MKRRRLLWSSLLLLAVLLFFVGPWPLPEDRYPETAWAQETFQRLRTLPVHHAHGPLQVGVARREITPPPGVPLGGYGARRPKANQGAREPLYATALTLATGPLAVTVVGADILLPLPKLVAAVRARLDLPPEALYFTANHTHSGPGGYDDGLVSQTNLGDFHPEYFERLATTLAQVVKESRARLQPARLRYTRLRLQGAARALVMYRLTHAPVHPTLHALEAFDRAGRRLALWLTTSAHPTVLGKHNRLASGDYPTILARALEADGGVVLFAAGAVGGTVPGDPHPTARAMSPETQEAWRRRLGLRLAALVRQGLAGGGPEVGVAGRWEAGEATLARARLQVTLPPPVYHLGERLRLSPWLVRALFHPAEHSWLDGLRLGPVWWVGIPADFSAELAERLEAWAEARGGYAWVTGFNGDYLGYLMPQARYATPHYTTRDASLYGASAGRYFYDLSEGLLARLAALP